jgi:hypothetical protein
MRIIFGVLIFWQLLPGRMAHAEHQKATVDFRAVEAKTACMAGEVQKGIRLLAELYTASNNPLWIFNQGRCYQQNAQPALALSRFKEFLRKSTEAEDVREAQKHIAELEAELQRSEPASKSRTAKVPEPDRTVDLSMTMQPTNPPLPIYKRWWFWTGVVAVVAAGSVTAIVLARSPGNSPCNGVGPNCVEFK